MNKRGTERTDLERRVFLPRRWTNVIVRNEEDRIPVFFKYTIHDVIN